MVDRVDYGIFIKSSELSLAACSFVQAENMATMTAKQCLLSDRRVNFENLSKYLDSQSILVHYYR